MVAPHPEASSWSFETPEPPETFDPFEAFEERVPAEASPGARRLPAVVPSSVEGLLSRLGGQLRRGGGVEPEAEEVRWSTGLVALDRLLDGGIPRGRLSEITGPGSGGRTSLAHGLLAHTTAAGEVAALVELADAFDPGSAHAAGARLERMLWVRAPDRHAALRSVEHLLMARGFALVVMDLAGPALPASVSTRSLPARASASAPRSRRGMEITPAVWPRLRKAARAAGTALVVLSDTPTTGSCADLALETEPLRPRFTGRPALLEGMQGEVSVRRNRIGPQLSRVPVQWPDGGSKNAPRPAAPRKVVSSRTKAPEKVAGGCG